MDITFSAKDKRRDKPTWVSHWRTLATLLLGYAIAIFEQHTTDETTLLSQRSHKSGLLTHLGSGSHCRSAGGSAACHQQVTVPNKWHLREVPVDIPSSTEWTPLQQVAVEAAMAGVSLGQNEIILGVSTAGGALGQLDTFIDRLKAIGIVHQFVLVALDESLTDPDGGFCVTRGIRCTYRNMTPFAWAAERHFRESISAMKYELLAEVLAAGVHVLLTDSDILFLDNPFCWLHRDSDIESQTDGGDGRQSYGWGEVIDEPPLFNPWRHHIYYLNAGFFYVRSSETTLAMMKSIADRLAVENLWDQHAFNEEVWTPRYSSSSMAHDRGGFGPGSPFAGNDIGSGITLSHELAAMEETKLAAHKAKRRPSSADASGDADGSAGVADGGGASDQEYEVPEPHVLEKLQWLREYRRRTVVGGRQPRVRVMDHLRFANSKVAVHFNDQYFKASPAALCPVVVHINYHLEKEKLLKQSLEVLFERCAMHSPRSTCQDPDSTATSASSRGTAAGGGAGSDGSASPERRASSSGSVVLPYVLSSMLGSGGPLSDRHISGTSWADDAMDLLTNPRSLWFAMAPPIRESNGRSAKQVVEAIMSKMKWEWERAVTHEEMRNRKDLLPPEIVVPWPVSALDDPPPSSSSSASAAAASASSASDAQSTADGAAVVEAGGDDRITHPSPTQSAGGHGEGDSAPDGSTALRQRPR